MGIIGFLKLCWHARRLEAERLALKNKCCALKVYAEQQHEHFHRLQERLCGVRFEPIPALNDTEWGLQIRFSRFDISRAVGSRDQVVRRYTGYVADRFAHELYRTLSK
jgi:hypothetical protein